MTSGAQQALRRTMELHSATTRFALACNQSSKIIEPIQSRCAIVRFMKLANEDVLKQTKWVAEQEGAAYDASGLEAITFTADGDMRQALNNLQATVAGFGFVNQVCPSPTPQRCLTHVVATLLASGPRALRACVAVQGGHVHVAVRRRLSTSAA